MATDDYKRVAFHVFQVRFAEWLRDVYEPEVALVFVFAKPVEECGDVGLHVERRLNCLRNGVVHVADADGFKFLSGTPSVPGGDGRHQGLLARQLDLALYEFLE